jgi:hypothetical protein
LVLFAGTGLVRFRDLSSQACGNVSPCTEESGFPLTTGIDYWFSEYFAVEGAYVRPSEVSIEGSGTGFRFTTAFEIDAVKVSAKVGAPLGRVRLYGQGGAHHHRATLLTTQTVDDVTIVDAQGQSQTIRGSSEVLELKTEGWGWQVGGGAEVWLGSWFGLYAELERAILKGGELGPGDDSLSDHMTQVFAGARVRIGG